MTLDKFLGQIGLAFHVADVVDRHQPIMGHAPRQVGGTTKTGQELIVVAPIERWPPDHALAARVRSNGKKNAVARPKGLDELVGSKERGNR